MRSIKIFAVCVVLFLLERVFFTRFQIFSLTPWLLFSFCAVSAAVHEELGWWILCAGLCGLAGDLAGGGAAGVGMAVYALGAVGIHVFAARIFRESMPFTIVIIFIFSIAAELLYFLLNRGGIPRVDWPGVLTAVVLPLAVINTAFAMLMYPLAVRFFRERRRL